MKTISAVKQDMEFNRSLSSLVEVLKNIAVSQYRTWEQKIKLNTEFLLNVEDFFGFLDLEGTEHPFLAPTSDNQLVLAVTSDSGLLGGLNMQVINDCLLMLQTKKGKLIVIGEKGKQYIQDLGIGFFFFKGIQEELIYEQSLQMRDYLLKSFLEEGIGYLRIVYPHPVSFTVQKIESKEILPFRVVSKKKITSSEIIFESTSYRVVEYLVYLWLAQKLYEIFSLSKLAEYAARFVHLEESTQKLKELDLKLRLQYFRLRHELIDRNMRELFSARLLYTGKL
ncbi:MAG: F0F1 ATP synthase subunit gamma [Candidatus Omnitrophica bacterium]|nr:F0F1 ATP synthase subunit gamma [Candidatus Omnitrophota bacterium]